MNLRWINQALALVLQRRRSGPQHRTFAATEPCPPAVRDCPERLNVLCARHSQREVEASVGSNTAPWSVSVLDERGQLLADINGWLPRIPASNQKLISSAFALDRLGPDFRLKTELLRHADGNLEIVGEGDPISASPKSNASPCWLWVEVVLNLQHRLGLLSN